MKRGSRSRPEARGSARNGREILAKRGCFRGVLESRAGRARLDGNTVMFLTLMVVGLVGLAAMAIPAFGHSHGALSGHGGIAHGLGHATATPSLTSGRGALQQMVPADPAHESRWRFVPSPRALFSVLALYGAFGNAGVHAFHLPSLLAALGAVLPALGVEWLLVRPLWRMLFRVQGVASTPLEQLVLCEARAVVPFRNGRGMISTVRDGRRVQLAASLRSDQREQPVKVGDRLVIEDVDGTRERVTVAIQPD
jgi:hypothetical protein